MTQRKITTSIDKIELCRRNGYVLEALLRNYHLNIDLIKMMLSSARPGYVFENKKFKVIVREFNNEISVNPDLKSIINKKTFRMVKTWLVKMEQYFKDLKLTQPGSTRQLLTETEKIFAVLNISANKLFARKKA